MNGFFISGNVCKDPEIFSPQNSEYSKLSFSVANSDESKKKSDGSGYENITSFFELEYWTKNPTHWLQKIKKGVWLAAVGRMKQERWEKEGGKHSKVVLIIDSFPEVKQSIKMPEMEIEKPALSENEKDPF